MLLFQVSWRTALPLAHTSEKQYWIKNFPDGENAGGGRDGGRGRNPHFHHRIFLLSEIALCGTKGFGLLRVLKLGQYRQRASLLKRSDFEVSADQSWLSNPYWFFKANKQVNINISFPHEKKQNKTKHIWVTVLSDGLFFCWHLKNAIISLPCHFFLHANISRKNLTQHNLALNGKSPHNISQDFFRPELAFPI